MIKRESFVEGIEVCALSGKHLVPLLSRRAGGQTAFGLFARSDERSGFAGLNQQMGGTVEDECAQVVV